MDRRIADAEANLRAAEKCEATSLFKRKPDYEGSASCYEKAALSFKAAKEWLRAAQAFSRCAVAQYNFNMVFSAARNLELAAAAAKDGGDLNECVRYYNECANYYLESGHSDHAADAIAKAAKVLETVNVDKSIAHYKRAIDIFEEDEKEASATQVYKNAVACAARNARCQDAIDLLRKQSACAQKLERRSEIPKIGLCMVIVELYRGDLVAADRCFEETCGIFPEFVRSEEGRSGAELLDAYEHQSVETIEAIAKRQVFTFIENEVAKLARKLRPGLDFSTPDSLPVKPSTSTMPTATTSSTRVTSSGVSDRDLLFAPSGKKTSTPTPSSSHKPAPTTTPTSEVDTAARDLLFAPSGKKKEPVKAPSPAPSPPPPTSAFYTSSPTQQPDKPANTAASNTADPFGELPSSSTAPPSTTKVPTTPATGTNATATPTATAKPFDPFGELPAVGTTASSLQPHTPPANNTNPFADDSDLPDQEPDLL
ncbi:soluble NSF attachment protein gamma [Pelomyxa schiedti]|nr:soluble NSF attachment protein gamma [Pelomyxa schiedti]